MHIHILGICGTFMGSLALIARQAGYRVTGSDQGIYPPMSDMLAAQDIEVLEGYRPEHLQPAPDCVVVGNALSRGNAAVEYLLEQGIDYRSGPQWLAENILHDKWVLAVSGTHGKTTTTSMLAWILEYAGLKPGFLIGGIPQNFGISARLGDSPFFVIEADEYDSAFFDKRSKFLHFRPRTLIVNNIEYDHADIFPDLASIQRQFHNLVRTVPGNGLIIANGDQASVAEMLAIGCWTPVQRVGEAAGNDWRIAALAADGGGFDFAHNADNRLQQAPLTLPGLHNAQNALAAIVAARHVGVPVETAVAALAQFRGVRRRLELRGEVAGVQVFDDFAHHPTAIEMTIAALRRQSGGGRILAVLEPRSNTMKLGVHRQALAQALQGAELSFLLQPAGIGWNVQEAVAPLAERAQVESQVEALVERIVSQSRPGDSILVMSNGAFGGIHDKLLAALAVGGSG
ncbi:MAG TPA: UDP-N-acetylmuramate:L-alanyl-gamma-D-glutamyl-meso-diaminopimelate ligase [Gammaproteobacteria bacterium]|nr:UDP-N-acetylmuramate:L-alanyl-gamma-D-glutamyl-meso-diaminopimelate ligase [Gammaproteobacteria bacterium]